MKKPHFVLTLALALGLLVGLTTGATVSTAYYGKMILIPSINVEDGWSTWIQAQNVGSDDTGAVVFYWGEYSGLCPSNSPGPAAVGCQTIVNNGVWTLRSAIPTVAKSAIIYSVDKDVFDAACLAAVDAVGDDSAWTQWKTAYQGTGQSLAAIVMRSGPNLSSSYVGISEATAYWNYALLLKKDYQGQTSLLSIQNAGPYCVSVWIEYRESDTGYLTDTEYFEALAPGEALHLKMEENEDIPTNWLGTAFIGAAQPLGAVVEHMNVPPTPTSTATPTSTPTPTETPTPTPTPTSTSAPTSTSTPTPTGTTTTATATSTATTTPTATAATDFDVYLPLVIKEPVSNLHMSGTPYGSSATQSP